MAKTETKQTEANGECEQPATIETLAQLAAVLLARIDRLETMIAKTSNPLMTIEELTELTGMCYETLWRRWTRGKMPKPLKFGHRTKRFRREDIEAWIDAGCRWPIQPASARTSTLSAKASAAVLKRGKARQAEVAKILT